MRELLQRAGLRIRSNKRADCAHCRGRSTGTVAYNQRAAYCHRCGWRSHKAQLERELGLRPSRKSAWRNTARPAAQAAVAARHRQVEAEISAFEAWLNWKLREMAEEEQVLCELKPQLSLALDAQPESDSLWDALAYLVRRRRELDAAWEFYLRDSLPQYREEPATLADLHAAFRDELWELLAPRLERKPVA